MRRSISHMPMLRAREHHLEARFVVRERQLRDERPAFQFRYGGHDGRRLRRDGARSGAVANEAGSRRAIAEGMLEEAHSPLVCVIPEPAGGRHLTEFVGRDSNRRCGRPSQAAAPAIAAASDAAGMKRQE